MALGTPPLASLASDSVSEILWHYLLLSLLAPCGLPNIEPIRRGVFQLARLVGDFSHPLQYPLGFIVCLLELLTNVARNTVVLHCSLGLLIRCVVAVPVHLLQH